MSTTSKSDKTSVVNDPNVVWMVTLSNGDYYEGCIHNGMMDGIPGGKAYYRFANGDEYRGDFGYSPDETYTYPDVMGTFTWANGSSYKGQFVYCRMRGDGIFTHHNKAITLSTRFLDWENILNQMILPDRFNYNIPHMEYYRDFEKNIVEVSGYRLK